MAAQVVAAAASGSTNEMSDAELVSKVGRNLVQNVKTKEEVPIESFWSEKTAVIMFLRRFG